MQSKRATPVIFPQASLRLFDSILRFGRWLAAIPRRMGLTPPSPAARAKWIDVIRRHEAMDAAHYRAAYGLPQDVDAAAHYVTTGAALGYDPCPEFRTMAYLAAHPDVRRSGHNPLAHYLEFGWREGRFCSPRFDAARYLAANPDIPPGVNPLAHYVSVGRAEKRPLRARPDAPRAPDAGVWEQLAREGRGRAAAQGAVVDVIVPVYRGREDTLACLYSVLAAPVAAPFELVVIDDRSPEEDLSTELRRLAGLGLFDLIRNEVNLGFVKSVNLGMRRSPSRHALLLNSDTEVYGDWLDRLLAHLRPGVATVTPLSNNATICSYPHVNADNDAPLELPYVELDSIAGRMNARESATTPTGVGFCMLIDRGALEAVGDFDEAAFGKGYGEENDFCMRAGAAGFLHLIALDVFVRHTGETSFAGEASESKKRAMETLAARWPGYMPAVREHIREDPAAAARRRLDYARLNRHAGGGPRSLCITHTWGGGVERHLRDKAAALRGEGRGVITAAPAYRYATVAALNAPNPIALPNLTCDLARPSPPEIAELRALAIDRIEIHSLVNWSSDMLEAAPRLADALAAPLHIMLHDYAFMCPQINFIDQSEMYCGEPPVRACARCVSKRRHTAAKPHGPRPFGGRIDVGVWRAEYGRLLVRANRVVAPSRDAAERFERYFPGLDVTVEPHEAETRPQRLRLPPTGDTARIVLIGAIGPHKGSRVLRACARDAAARDLPLHFHVIGHTDIDAGLSALANVTIAGRYREDDLPALLAAERGHIAFLPSVWPETYGYTLSAALEAGFFPVVFDIGAMAARVRASGVGRVLPLNLARDPAVLNDALLAAARANADLAHA
ncbi:MAG: glycosyltransferase [Hyphomicrobiales bacterium]|nr:glycosyltransferase [Hyphomicrobiales bacterium]